MADLSFAQLIAVMHDNLQRSYELIEDLTVLDRDEEGLQKVVVALSEAEVELPISIKLNEQKVRASTVLKRTENMSAYELAQMRVDMPTMDPSLKAAVREQLKLAHSKDALAIDIDREVRSAQSLDDENKKNSQNDITISELKKADTEISNRRKQITREVGNQSHLARDLRVSVLGQDTSSADKSAHIGRVTFRFKTTLK